MFIEVVDSIGVDQSRKQEINGIMDKILRFAYSTYGKDV